MSRVQIPVSFQYVASGNLVPVVGGTVSITDRDTSAPATLWSGFTGSGTIAAAVTDAVGNVPGYLDEGSYAINVGPVGSFGGSTLNWEAVRGDGVQFVADGAISTASLANDAVTYAKLDPTTVVRNLVPVGAVLDFAGATPPNGFVMANGQILSQSAFPILFSVLGTAFNTGGEGAGNFRVPNLTNRFSLGWGGVTPPYNTLGASGGALGHTHSVPAHSHPLSNNGGSLPGQQLVFSHYVNYPVMELIGYGINAFANGPTIPVADTVEYQLFIDGIESTTGTTTTTPTMQLFGNTDVIGAATTSAVDPAYLVMNKIIKCDVGT